MLRIIVPVFFLLTSFIIFQNCSSQLQSQTIDSDTGPLITVLGLPEPPPLSDEFSSLLESMNLDSSIRRYKVIVRQDISNLIIEVPNSTSGSLDITAWSLVSEIGEEVNLGLSGNPVDLNSLNIEIETLTNSVLIAKDSSNNDVSYIYLLDSNNYQALFFY